MLKNTFLDFFYVDNLHLSPAQANTLCSEVIMGWGTAKLKKAIFGIFEKEKINLPIFAIGGYYGIYTWS